MLKQVLSGATASTFLGEYSDLRRLNAVTARIGSYIDATTKMRRIARALMPVGKGHLQEEADYLLRNAGIELNSANPNAWDMQVHDPRFYRRVLLGGSLALGRSYMDGWWEVEALDQFFEKLTEAHLDEEVLPWDTLIRNLRAKILNLQNQVRSIQVAREHYDLSPFLYEQFLDPEYMQYTCGYYSDGNETLDEAQKKKLRRICDKLDLQEGDAILDIGCGWGGFAKYVAKHHPQCHVTGISISDEQIAYAREICRQSPVDIYKLDYRQLAETFERGRFNKVLVCGMAEHVGEKNYRALMKAVEHCLTEDGRFLLHTITGRRSTTHVDPFISTEIFPNGKIPSHAQIIKAADGLLRVFDTENFGPHYDKTLMHWFERFNNNWPAISSRLNLDDRFYRKWKYYLLSCAGAFRSGSQDLCQTVFTKKGAKGQRSIR
jgi:cyclopropane-fatty-acyl-phospholipid synthase